MRRALAFLAVVAACLGLLAAPASAERVVGRDGRADVVRISGSDLARSARPEVDLVRFAVRYGRHRISAVLRYRDLRPRGDAFSAGLAMDFPAGHEMWEGGLDVTAGPGDRRGTAEAWADGSDGLEPGPDCRVRHRIDYRRDVVRISAPAHCFGRPRYVDAFVRTHVVRRDTETYWADVAPATYREISGDAPSHGRSPFVRVRRG
ncbi:hypothetical protein GCM10023340_18310 [Nocardioides marinquilinus]|uniref:Uncharacterized protein n=1 Tax=Nocardioides marinquilinus TaxID=1210400 RepID=A0ABP9PHQ2_9ACTN